MNKEIAHISTTKDEQKAIIKAFNKCFDGDPQSEHFLKVIPTLDHTEMKDFLMDYVKVIQLHPFKPIQFVKFKKDIIDYVKEEEIEFLINYAGKFMQPERPYIAFDFYWDYIDTPEACFLAYMIITNTSVTLPEYPLSIWNFIPDPDDDEDDDDKMMNKMMEIMKTMNNI